ncbi:MAG: TIR domain-containing protein [Chloroflexi bacterium]|nr:TIR domain-containing protein [Chloroflexota bacterium]
MDYKHDVFLSYSHKDSVVMRQVRDSLRTAGLGVWTDEGIEPGTADWRLAIEEAIKHSCCLVVILSPDAAGSRYVREEISFAENWGVRFFPVLARGSERDAVPSSLILTQRIDIRSHYDSQMQQLILAVNAHLNSTTLSTDLSASPAMKGKQQKEYELKRKWRMEKLEEELYKAEQNNDVIAYLKAERDAEQDLELLAIELDLQSAAHSSEKEFLLKRKRILISQKYQNIEGEANNDVKKIIESQQNAEREAWQLEDKYQLLHGTDDRIIEDELYKEAVHLVRENSKASAFDLRWQLLLKPERATRFIEKMLNEGILDPNTKKATERDDGWEYSVIQQPPSNAF